MRTIHEAIDKLISDYEQKINDQEELNRLAQVEKRAARRRGDQGEIEFQLKELAVINARKQAYIQAKVDIESLKDNVDFAQ